MRDRIIITRCAYCDLGIIKEKPVECHMSKKFSWIIFVILPMFASSAMACYDHMRFNPDNLGFVGGTMARMAGLVPPKPTFDIVHPAMVRSQIGKKSEIIVSYSRPVFSKNVRLKVRGTDNVSLELQEVALDDRSGSVNVGYLLSTGSGYESIILTISGEHNGKTVNQSSQIYLRGV